jgi:hypothetical protein
MAQPHHNGGYGVADLIMINCTGCGLSKGQGEYYSAARGGGIRQPCKHCTRNDRRDRYRNADGIQHVRRQNLARYGLNPEDYDRMLAAQDGLCATCRQPQPVRNKSLCVDHDHQTGAVRALLCDPCNLVIGYIEKHQVPLAELVAYLARHQLAGGA